MSASEAVMRSSQSAGTTLSASVVAYQVRAGSTPSHNGPRVLEARGPSGADIARVDLDEMHVGAELPDQAVAAVIGGIEHHHGQHRNRQADRGRRQAPADSAAGAPARCARAPRRRPSRAPCLVNSQIVAISHLAWRTSSDEHDLPHRHLPVDDFGCQQGRPVTALQLAGEALHRLGLRRQFERCHAAGVAPGATAPPDRPEMPSATSISGIR